MKSGKKRKRGGKDNEIFKRIFLTLIILIIITGLILISYSGYRFYKSSKDVPENTKEQTSQASRPSSTKPSSSSSTSKPRKPKINPCKNINDTYKLPDFNQLMNLMKNQDLVKDVPKKGSIKIRFFHFTQGCRIWDKTYILSGGIIEEKNTDTDIYVQMHTDYAKKINESNLCDIIIEARNNGDLGQWTDLGKTTLLWRYKSMMKYKGCLGL
ncbi:hypothetical protein GF386_02875 [Candidatus Pacearchaeota archaeon]|nr:hypothetical protein [Candidatus Pacearchaeota archaeon]MBD3283092.1 hypothetical protein [Candidatus Pacearchaeota archaeon]